MVEQESDELQSVDVQGDMPAEDATEPQAKEDELSNLDRAKAFMRALYTGGEANPADFGFKTDGEAQAACKNCQSLEKQLQDATTKASETDGLYRRMAADFENYRRRIDREREEFQTVGVKKVIEALLPALDDLDRAQASLTSNLPPEKIIESMKVVCNSLNRALEQVGVKQLNVIGEQFDPRLHEPVQQIETDEFADNAVMHELRKGYTLNDKVIRPALVNVATGKPQAETEESSTDSKAKSATEEPVVDEKLPTTVYDLGDEEQYEQSTALGEEADRE
jgi:molecular chaperone GrpE